MSNNATLRRLFALEFRTAIQGEARMSGHASIFNRAAKVGSYYERIAPTAFDKALSRPDDVRFLLNHNPDNLLGRTASGTLRLTRDDAGLMIDGDLPDTTLGHDVRELVKRGDLSGMSFGYMPNRDADTYDVAPDGLQVITRNDVDLYDVSLATFPAYAEADDVVLRAVDFANMPKVRSNHERLIRARAARNTR